MTKIEQKDWIAPKGHPMAGDTIRMVSVVFNDGKDPEEIFLTYAFNRICDVEKESEMKLGLTLVNPSAQEVRAIVCAYLRTAHAVTLEEAGDLLTRDRSSMLVALSKAMALSDKEEPTEEPKEPVPPASAQTDTVQAA